MRFRRISKRNQNDSIHRALLSSSVISTIILVIPITILTIYLMRVRFYDQIEYVSKQVRTETMQTIKGRVEEALSYTDFMEKKLDERAKVQVKDRTLEAHAIATGVYYHFKEKVPLPELMIMVREALRPIRFDNGRGYYFATDFNGVEQLFADRPEMEGKNLIEMKDTDGRPVIQDMILIAKTKEEGFYEYLWTKPDQPGAKHRKLSYVKRFAPFDWLIGTGLYVDDVEEDIKTEVLNRIGTMRWGDDEYLFVFMCDGFYLQHVQKKYIGQNLLHIEDPNGVRINERLVEICKSGGGFLEYVWDKYSTGQLIPKISYAKGHAKWGWVIGSGSYMEDIKARQESMVAKLKTDTLIAIVTLASMAVLSLLVSLIITQRFRKKLDVQMQPILDFMNAHPENRPSINIEDQQFMEFRTIASAANQHDRLWHETKEELREREKLQRLLLESTAEGIYGIDGSGRCTFVNGSAEKMWGYEEGELIGRKLHRLIHHTKSTGEPYPEDECKIQQIFRTGTPAHIQQDIMWRKDAGSIPVEVWAHPIKEQGQVVGVVVTFFDITDKQREAMERERLEGQLQQAQKMESIGSLAGGIAHDLNNILFPISGLSEILLDEIPPDTPAYESIEQIYKSAQRGSDLVKQILTFSRQSKPQRLPIRIQPILKEILKLVRSTIPMIIEITSHIKPDCGMVFADPTHVHQIMMNLITNAYHAVEEKGGTINIELKEAAIRSSGGRDDLLDISMPRDLSAGRYACITVSDTGTGIDQTLIDKIYEPYFTTKEQGKGTGLGLSVVHGIVKEHGGDIRVYSVVGKGTTFNVYLPLLGDTIGTKATTVTSNYPTGCERILLVDDEEPIVRMEQIMLEKLGYQVTARTNSPDALAAFKANPGNFDLVISDRGMPNMTGDQLAEELISIRPDIPIIICTGFSDENEEQRTRDLGIKGLLKKPVARSDLAEMVRKVLDEGLDTKVLLPISQREKNDE